ncbi:PREDICTED: uncharacterized protein LOC107354951 [Acropora digitifera]|uniref:uncharacterized protein LOC107354951 n=1 Tax=Acropora digitifera TaxID=70779 RepID=UPI00077AC5DF|nr:PREDICTED: uncharacterized protein LOC107354951 [Acropora digitifera]
MKYHSSGTKLDREKKNSNRTQITISDRRRLMYASPAISDAKKEYPTLFNCDQMVAEFEKILGLQQSIAPNATANFHQVTEGILQEAKQKAVGKKIEELLATSVRQFE